MAEVNISTGSDRHRGFACSEKLSTRVDLTPMVDLGFSYGYTNYSPRAGLGDIIRMKQLAMDRVKPGNRKELMLIIKPAEGSKFENIINALDEVLINDVSHYAIVDINPDEEMALLEKK
jgi:hypothetical protein